MCSIHKENVYFLKNGDTFTCPLGNAFHKITQGFYLFWHFGDDVFSRNLPLIWDKCSPWSFRALTKCFVGYTLVSTFGFGSIFLNFCIFSAFLNFFCFLPPAPECASQLRFLINIWKWPRVNLISVGVLWHRNYQKTQKEIV